MSEVYAQSTAKSRTEQSATSQLQGLFNDKLSFPSLQLADYPLHIFSPDHLILVENDGTCPRYTQVSDDVEDSDETLGFKERMNRVLEAYIYPKMREQASMPDATSDEMSDVCTYVWWAVYHGIKLIFDVPLEDVKWCEAAADQFLYEWFVASDEFWHLSSY